MPLTVGQDAPLFILPSTEGNKFDLSEVREPLILFFYPKDFTPGCTKEACSFRDNFDFFKNLKIKVVGISTDSISKHIKFKEAHGLPFPLLSDATGKVCKLYKAHVPLLNIAKRTTYLIDAQKKIAASYNDLLGAGKHIKTMIEKVKKTNPTDDRLP
ncbi:MAG: peroxiredoxin [Bacteroidota bacterium]